MSPARELFMTGWRMRLDADDAGVLERWYGRHLGKEWEPIELPGPWERNGLDGDPGWAWFRLDTGAIAAAGRVLWLAGIDGRQRVWVNGREARSVAAHPARFAVAGDALNASGANSICVRVADRGAAGNILRGAWLAANDAGGAAAVGRPVAARASHDWVRDAVIYSAYLRSASPEANFAGLEKRLGELADLGVTLLWLLPIHPVGRLRRKGALGSPYAVQDFRAVNPEFGTLDDFKRLLAAAHARGMKLIIDLVANHTAWDNPLISDHPDWFARDERGEIRPPVPDWSDVAQLDYSKPALREWMIETLEWWVRDVGIDGFRCDVADMVPLDFWEQARPRLDAIKPVVMLAEGDKPDDHLAAFDLTYDWWTYKALGRLPQGTLTAEQVQQFLADEAIDYPAGSLRLRMISNHDLNAWHKPAAARYRDAARAASVITFALPGVPLIYTGDEVGSAARLDLFERIAVDWRADDHGMRSHLTALARLRREHAALRGGALRWFATDDRDDVLLLAREAPREAVFVAVSLADQERRIVLPEPMRGATPHAACNAVLHGTTQLALPAWGYAVMTKRG